MSINILRSFPINPKSIKHTLTGWGGAGVIVTEGDKSLTPGGKLELGRPMEDLCCGWGTERLVLFIDDVLKGVPCMLLLRGGTGCC